MDITVVADMLQCGILLVCYGAYSGLLFAYLDNQYRWPLLRGISRLERGGRQSASFIGTEDMSIYM